MKRIFKLAICLMLALSTIAAQGAEAPKIRKPVVIGPVGFSKFDVSWDYTTTNGAGEEIKATVVYLYEGGMMQALYDNTEFIYDAKGAFSQFSLTDERRFGRTDNIFSAADGTAVKIADYGITPYPSEKTDNGWSKGLTWKFNFADGRMSYAKDWYVAVDYNGERYYYMIYVKEKPNLSKQYLAGISLTKVYEEPKAVPVTPSNMKVIIDGREVMFDIYLIDGNNYFKLRDVAMALKGSYCPFNVKYHEKLMFDMPIMYSHLTYTGYGVIEVITDEEYEPVGGELAISDKRHNQAKTTVKPTLFDGKNNDCRAYMIGGNTYFKLRDIAKYIDFGVSYDEKTRTIFIETDKFYEE